MSRQSAAFAAGLSALALLAVAGPGSAAPDAGSAQALTNTVGGAFPTDVRSAGVGSQAVGDAVTPAALSTNVLESSTSGNGLPLPEGSGPDGWKLDKSLGEPLATTADLALASQGGMAGQGVDPGVITNPLGFKDVLPAGVGAQLSGALGMVPGLTGAP